MKSRYFNYLELSIVFLFLSCEIPYEDNARLLIKGELRDGNGLPIEAAEVSAFLRKGDDFLFFSGPSTSSGEELGATLSNEDGGFQIISLFGRDEDFVVEIYKEGFSKYQYRTSLDTFTPENYTIDVETVTLNPLANFNFVITRTTSDAELAYSFTYPTTKCRVVFEEGILIEDESFCNETNVLFRELASSDFSDSASFETLVNSEVIFTYALDGGPQQTQLLTIDQSDYEFNFSF